MRACLQRRRRLSSVAARACARHARRSALSQCVSCGRPLCAQCMVYTTVGYKCHACTGTRASGAARRRSHLLSLVGLAAGAGAIVWALSSSTGGNPTEQENVRAPGDAPAGLSTDTVRRAPVRFRGAGAIPLSGTLDVPGAGARASAAVLIIPGFGPTNRDGVVLGPDRTDALYRDLGDVLARDGFVVLRYDKRSTAGRATPGRPPLRFDHYVGDARAALDFLRRRPELDAAAALVVAGHDEGGLIGMRVASRDRRLAGLALVSTPGRPLARVVADEVRGGAFGGSDRSRAKLAREFTGAVATVVETGRVPAVSPELQPVLPRSRAAYLRALFSLDPAAEAGGVRQPVLIVRGARDPGIRPADVHVLRGAFRSSREVTLLRVPQAGHTLKQVVRSTGGHGSIGSRSARRSFGALRRIAAWARAQAARGTGR